MGLSDDERWALLDALFCSQCGVRYSMHACGPTHALIQTDPLKHHLLAPLADLIAMLSQDRDRLLAVVERSAEAIAAVRERFTSCWCNPGSFSGEENVDWRSEDCPLHGSGLAQHMAEAVTSLLPPKPTAATQEAPEGGEGDG